MGMKILFPALFAFGLMGIAPAIAQALPPTSQQIQQQNDQYLQNQNNALQQSMTQTQLGLIQDQQRRDQLFATQPPVFQQPLPPPQPITIPSPPPKP